MSRRAPRQGRHARRDPENAPAPAPGHEPGTPVNPGAWDARSWVLSAQEPVVWPEAGSEDVPPPPPTARRVTPPPPSPDDRLADPPRTVRSRVAPATPVTPPGPDARPPAGAASPEAAAWPVAGGEVAGSVDGQVSSGPRSATRRRGAGSRSDGRPPATARQGATDASEAADRAARAAGPAGGGGVRGRAADGRREASASSHAPSSGPGGRPVATAPAARGRRGSADPVRQLMRRHRQLCEQAVDPLEIAAGLEAHGVTDRTAARFRHRDVFSLAEELFVRVPRAEAAASPAAAPAPAVPLRGRRRVVRALVPVLPGALCTAALVALALAVTAGVGGPAVRLGVGLAGALAVFAAVHVAVRGMPRTRVAVLWACWLVGYAVLGDGALSGLLAGGRPADAVAPDLSLALVVAWAVAPAAWCGRWFARRARSRLPASRSLGDFASGVRPLLAAAAALFVASLAVLRTAVDLGARLLPVPLPGAAGPDPALALPGDLPRAALLALTGGQSGWQLAAVLTAEAALGVLFFTAALLAAHGAPGAASAGMGAACAVEAAALGAVLVARLPGLGLVGRPVEYLTAAAGPAAVPALACAGAAIGVLVRAVRVLAGASAHQGRRGW